MSTASFGSPLEVFQSFVRELRAVGIPVSTTEDLDAMRAVETVGLTDRVHLREALAATLVKRAAWRSAFDTVFDVYFAPYSAGIAPAPDAALWGGEIIDGGGGAGTGELAEALRDALLAGDLEALARLASAAVQALAGMEPGRPVGGTYYLYRTLRQLDADVIANELLRALTAERTPDDALGEMLVQHETQLRMDALRNALETEIRARLVADRGVDAMARTLRAPLPEDVDFMHASRDDMAALQHTIQPLTRTLAARLAQRRRHRNRGTLDMRATIRTSLSYGGVPAEPRFRSPRPAKPEIMVLADISGSVASFARFTLQLVYAMANQFSKVRSWVFIDGIDEVTGAFSGTTDLNDAIRKVNTEANVVWVDGHSDYGHALSVFHERHALEVTPRTAILILGDARNNYHPSHNWVLADLRRRAKAIYWLDPEARAYWDTGDSIVSEYAQFCDGCFECRNLRQLEAFVAALIEP
ncbi:MAG: vWA domain-containing protein [Acidimicrobiia bacterium]